MPFDVLHWFEYFERWGLIRNIVDAKIETLKLRSEGYPKASLEYVFKSNFGAMKKKRWTTTPNVLCYEQMELCRVLLASGRWVTDPTSP